MSIIADIANIEVQIESLQNQVRALRDHRAALITDASPYKVGERFTRGLDYRVKSISPGSRGSTVYLHCYWLTSTGQWSKGTKVISFEIK